MNNEKQLGLFSIMYANDYDDMLPGIGTWAKPYFTHFIGPYLGVEPLATAQFKFDTTVDIPLFRCPSDDAPLYSASGATHVAGRGGLSYGESIEVGRIFKDAADNFFGNRIAAIRGPSSVFIYMDSKYEASLDYYTHGRIGYRHQQSGAQSVIDTTSNASNPPVQNGGVNITFCDGHVEGWRKTVTTGTSDPDLQLRDTHWTTTYWD